MDVRKLSKDIFNGIVGGSYSVLQSIVGSAEENKEHLGYKQEIIEIISKVPSMEVMTELISAYSCAEITDNLRIYVKPLGINSFEDGKTHLLEKCPFDLSNLNRDIRISQQKKLYGVIKKWLDSI